MRAGFVTHRKRVVQGFSRALREGGTRRLPWQDRGEAVFAAALRAACAHLHAWGRAVRTRISLLHFGGFVAGVSWHAFLRL